MTIGFGHWMGSMIEIWWEYFLPWISVASVFRNVLEGLQKIVMGWEYVCSNIDIVSLALSLVLVSFLHHYLKVLMIFTWLCIIFPYPWLLCIERSCVGRSGLIMSLWEFFLFCFGKSLWSIWFGLVSQVDNWFLVLLLLSYSNREFIVLCGRFHGGMHILRVSIIS